MTQAELLKHFTEANHHGFLEDISFHIIGRVFLEFHKHISRDSGSLDYRENNS